MFVSWAFIHDTVKRWLIVSENVVFLSCCKFTSTSNFSIIHHPSIHLLNTYTNLVRGLSLEFTTSSDMALVETNSNSRLGSNHCIYDERGGAISNLQLARLSTAPLTPPSMEKKITVKTPAKMLGSNRKKATQWHWIELLQPYPLLKEHGRH